MPDETDVLSWLGFLCGPFLLVQGEAVHSTTVRGIGSLGVSPLSSLWDTGLLVVLGKEAALLFMEREVPFPA